MVCTRRMDYGEPDGSDTATFALFPKLPPELRIEVWKMSMTPRLVVVKPSPNTLWYKPQFTYRKKSLPVQFYVNCEARSCALDHYNLRFTITVITEAGPPRGQPQSSRYHANVVMSSDDTLGLLGWGQLAHRSWKFQAESVAWTGAWVNNRPSTCGAPVDVKKVAYLSTEIGRRPRILHALNSTVSWDVNSILHTKSTKLTKLYPLGPPWYKHAAYAMECISIHSRDFSGTLQEWANRVSYRALHGGLPVDYYGSKLPDIMAFELGKEPEEALTPANVLQNWRSGHEDYYYFWKECKWLRTHPCPQGF